MGYRNTSAAAVLIAVMTMSSCAAPPGQEDRSSAASQPAQWSTYTTADRRLAFEYPGDWSVSAVEPLANDPDGGVSVRVRDGAGRIIAALDTGLIVGQECSPPAEPTQYTEYEARPMPDLTASGGTQQRFVYHSVDPAEGPSKATYAVVSGAEETGQCGLFDFFRLTESSGGRFMGEFVSGQPPESPEFLEEAAAYPQTEEYRDVLRMLTSLRNAD
ncbi:hypothetical protein BN1051_02878 [Arthrobacter saudimassiliensis]|uniref:Lipoprotein n=1 Tax=Arthrobacter saudimassiliensis TaxID=1461584 RepID=A0A078MQL3_9MICC|nr:hypothetical protein BN1051_02878 [Arthrobacter saudimassiliensis]